MWFTVVKDAEDRKNDSYLQTFKPLHSHYLLYTFSVFGDI